MFHKPRKFYIWNDVTYDDIFISSSSFKEPSAHVASVKNILEGHASYLMSGKELSKLVAFVKGTQFDLVVGKSYFKNFLNVQVDSTYWICVIIVMFAGISPKGEIWKCSFEGFCIRA